MFQGIYHPPDQQDQKNQQSLSAPIATGETPDTISSAQKMLAAYRSGESVRGGLLSSEIEQEHVYKVTVVVWYSTCDVICAGPGV